MSALRTGEARPINRVAQADEMLHTLAQTNAASSAMATQLDGNGIREELMSSSEEEGSSSGSEGDEDGDE